MSTLAVSHQDLRTISDELEGRSAEDVLAWAADRFAGRIVLTCSWQMQSSVLVDMLHRIGAEVRIVELDTGQHWIVGTLASPAQQMSQPPDGRAASAGA